MIFMILSIRDHLLLEETSFVQTVDVEVGQPGRAGSHQQSLGGLDLRPPNVVVDSTAASCQELPVSLGALSKLASSPDLRKSSECEARDVRNDVINMSLRISFEFFE